MNAFSSRAVDSYTKIGVETGVVSASSHQLILMLYQGAIAAITSAQQHLRLKNTAAKGESLSKAISIIDDGLKASLDLSVGGQMAQNLSDLYAYMSQRLLVANIKNDSAALDEVTQLLQQLSDAWESIGTKQATNKAATSATRAAPGGTASPLQTSTQNQAAVANPGQERGTGAVTPPSQQSRIAAAYGVR